MVDIIKKIERNKYPAPYQQMQDCETIEDIIYYCEADDIQDLVMEVHDKWYFLAVKSTCEIVDIAGEMTLSDLLTIRRLIYKEFSGKVIKLDARERTSYRIVRTLGTIIRDEPYEWDGEIFHDMRIKINSK